MLHPVSSELFVKPQIDLVSWGHRLATARKAAGYSQRKAGEMLGVGQRIIVQWERGRFAPMGDRLRALAVLYGVPLSDIVP